MREFFLNFKASDAGPFQTVKVAQYGNAGTAYIGKPGAWFATVSDA